MATLTFIGHSAFKLEADRHQVLIDPFITGNPSATHVVSDFNPQTVLITHAHNDHVGDAPDISIRTGATVITVVELADYLEGRGASVIPANIGGTAEFQGGTVKFVPAWHSSSLTLDGARPSLQGHHQVWWYGLEDRRSTLPEIPHCSAT